MADTFMTRIERPPGSPKMQQATRQTATMELYEIIWPEH